MLHFFNNWLFSLEKAIKNIDTNIKASEENVFTIQLLTQMVIIFHFNSQRVIPLKVFGHVRYGTNMKPNIKPFISHKAALERTDSISWLIVRVKKSCISSFSWTFQLYQMRLRELNV